MRSVVGRHKDRGVESGEECRRQTQGQGCRVR